ncbi:DUF6884 domain-containing protein [Streptomyces sp. NPDC002324]
MMTNGEHGTRRGWAVDEYAAPRKAPYTGALAWAERMYADGEYGEVIVRVHDAGQLGTVRREAAERLADGYGVRARRFEEGVPFSRQGGRCTGEDVRVARHALRIEGPVLKVARFVADLPQLLAAIERAATTMMRTLSRWMRDSAHGQRWTDIHDAAHWRTERRYWRRSYIRHLAGWIGPEATDMNDAPMPDWSENWLHLQARIAQATASTVDVEAARDHMAEALLFAKAARPEPRRYATVYDAIHAPVEHNEEIGNVEFCYGDPAELARQARDEAPAPVAAPAEEPAAPAAAAEPRRILTLQFPALGDFPADDRAPEYGVFHVAGPGVLGPGTHIEYLPQHRPGPRTRHAHGGTVVSLARRTVLWRPYGQQKTVRTPLEAMRVDASWYPDYTVADSGRLVQEVGHPCPWATWSLAEHLAHGRRPAAPAQSPAAVENEAPAAQLALFEADSTTDPSVTAAAAGPVVVIPCSGRKLDRSAPAGEIYTGTLHRRARRTADVLTSTGGTVLVLSALHGLVPLDRVIEPYDHQWSDPGSITVDELRAQADAFGLADAERVILLTPSDYTKHGLAVWPTAHTPLAHLGIGRQLGRLAALCADNLTIAA